MRRVDLAKLVFAVLGVAIWGYGVRTDAPKLEWLGVAVIVVAFLIRFLPGAGSSRRRRP
ncbi:MAG TPA: hypothetical protein VFW98_10030 [Gemmatimonadaceae bacterium]|nr:hypothetical protein [Gemmatimonadaceae bacterium]